MQRGEFTAWMLFAMSGAGLLLPHLFARDFLDSASVVRWIAGPIFVVTGITLADHHLFGNALLRAVSGL